MSKRDGFDVWAAENGLPATVQIEGDEVVVTNGNEELRNAILATIRVFEHGPRSAMNAVLDELRATGDVTAIAVAENAKQAAGSARSAEILGNDLEAQELEAQAHAFVDHLRDLAADLEPDVAPAGWEAIDRYARTVERELADAAIDLAAAQRRMRDARLDLDRVTEALGYYGDRGARERDLAGATIRRLGAGASAIARSFL